MNRIEHPWHLRFGAALCLASAAAMIASMVLAWNFVWGLGA